jgi:hypothetical protein
VAALTLLSLTSISCASVNLAGTLLTPTVSAPKRCSGAFRFAARDGNSDIMPISVAQAVANDRRFQRTRTAERAMFGLESERSRLHAMTLMCGR